MPKFGCRITLRNVLLPAAAALWFAGASMLAAQTPPTTGIRGIAYDSLHKTPLRGAMISVDGTRYAAFTDSLGAFQFDSLVAGTYAFSLSHPSLDSIGLSTVTNRVRTPASGALWQLGIPSFGTLWSR